MNAVSKMQVDIRECEIVFTRMFDASRQMVWDAWTKEDNLLKWWAPHGFTNRDCSVDLRKGGRMLITMVGQDGSEYPCEFIFDEIVPIEKIVWTDVVHDGDYWGPDGPPPSSVITNLFEDHGNKTKMVMISKFETNEGRDRVLAMGAAEGWGQSLERLDDLLKG